MYRPFLLYRLLTVDLPPIQRHSRWRRLYALGGRGQWPPSAAGTPYQRRGKIAADRRRRVPVFTGGERRAHGEGQKGKRAPYGSLSPLDSPKPSFEPLSKAFAAKRGKRRLGSVRRFAYGTLLCPEVTLRKPPRITVRGQTVQSACFALRNASLRSSVYPWSTKRPCGPLAF